MQIPSPTAPGTPSSQQSINVIQNDEQNKTISILKVPEAPVLRPSNEVYISPATVESSRRESNVCQRGEEKRHLSVHFESFVENAVITEQDKTNYNQDNFDHVFHETVL